MAVVPKLVAHFDDTGLYLVVGLFVSWVWLTVCRRLPVSIVVLSTMRPKRHPTAPRVLADIPFSAIFAMLKVGAG